MRHNKVTVIQEVNSFVKSSGLSTSGEEFRIMSIHLQVAAALSECYKRCYLCSSAFTSGLIITAKPDGLCLNFLLFCSRHFNYE